MNAPSRHAGPIRVLIVDDSALVRQLLTEICAGDPEIAVVGTAPDPIVAREKIKTLSPDVITLDIEMPRMNGIEFLERLMRLRPMPVVMISTLTREGADVTLRALELGAVDYVAKPTRGLTEAIGSIRDEILDKIKTAAGAHIRGARPGAARAPQRPPAIRDPRREIIAIGASTGGVEAVAEVLTALPADTPGVVIVQHMPGTFTGRFAARLDAQLPLSVREAGDGMPIRPGQVLIAPGGRHCQVYATAEGGMICRLDDGPPVSGHRPSVDVLFRSVARLGERAVGVLLTGMGRDGAEGLLAMRQAGALTIAQDAATCVVHGMPRAAMALGAVQIELPLSRIAAAALEN